MLLVFNSISIGVIYKFTDTEILSSANDKNTNKQIKTVSIFSFQGISVIDSTNTKAQARLTAGGLTFTYANIKLKSERGEPLNYQIQIFV